MAKKKKQNMIDCAVSVPIPVLAFYMDVAKLAHVTVNDALNVVLAITVLQEKEKATAHGKRDAQ